MIHRVPGRVTRITDFTDRVRRFFVRPEAPLAFRAGQYVTLRSGTGSGAAESAFSICSPPGSLELEFYGSFQGDGPVATAFRSLSEGRRLELGTPKGTMTLDAEAAGRHLFIATVTGAGPFLSMIRQAVAEGGGPEMMLFHGCRRSAELGDYHAELEELARNHAWFRYIPSVSRPGEDPAWTGETGRATEVLLRRLSELDIRPGNTTAYVCGNPDVVAEATSVLGRAGFPGNAVRMEEYLRGLVL